jgi:hypothetical protein
MILFNTKYKNVWSHKTVIHIYSKHYNSTDQFNEQRLEWAREETKLILSHIDALEKTIKDEYLSQVDNDSLKKLGYSVEEYKRSVEKDIEEWKKNLKIAEKELKSIEREKRSRIDKKVRKCLSE